MFDDLLRRLRDLDGARISVNLPCDEDGYFDRQCVSDECSAIFKIHDDDWRDKVSDDVCYCPICKNESNPHDCNTEEQTAYAEQVALAHVEREVNEGLRRSAEHFNRQQRPGFITMKMSVKPGSPPMIMPLRIAEAMQQKFACESCNCRYASIGAAFFCPACGHNSVTTTFDLTVEAVRKTMGLLPVIRGALVDAGGKDAAQDAARQIIESQLAKLVGTFQRFAEAMFAKLPNASQFKVGKNTFQRLADSGDLWKQAAGRGYADMLTAGEMSDLVRLFQQRHLIAHRDGLVDQEYIDKSGDTSYAVGQRLVVQEGAVIRLADVIVKLAAGIKPLVP